MIISCPNCHKRYQLSPKSAHPPPVIQCPACKGKISLPQLWPEKKEMIHGIYQLTCPGCQKVYRIPIDKIPAGKTRARCKVCGQGIDLRPLLHKKPVAPSPRAAVAGKAAADLPQPRVSKPVPRKHTTQETKPRRRAITASVVGVVVVLVVLVWVYGPHHAWKSKDIAPNLVLPEILNPVASLRIDVPALMAFLKQQSERRKPTQRVLAFLEQIEQLKLTRIDLAVYPDTNDGALAVLALRGRRETLRHRLLAEDALLGPYIEKVSDGIYRFKATAFTKQPIEKVSLDLYELRLVDDDCIVAPRTLIDLLPEGLDLITHAPVTRFAATLKQPNHVADFAIRLPAEWRTGWEQKLAGHPVLKEIPNAGIFTGVGAALVQQLTEPFQQLEYMALGLAVGEHQRRLLSYAQQFRPEIDGAAIYQKLQHKNANGAPGVLSGVLEILADPLFETGARFNANRLSINIGWDEKDDQAVLAALSSATIGQLLTHSMMRGGEPSKGPIITVYAAAPHLVSEVEEDRLTRALPKRIGKGLFPDDFSPSGTEPSLTFALDPVPIPNAVLAEVDYDVLSIQAPDGHSILRKDDQTFKPPIDLTGRYSSRIRLDVMPGTQAKDLGTARLHFNIATPTALNIFKFKAGTGPSIQKSDLGIQVAAERIERDIAQVSVKGGESIWLFAFDDTGRALSAKEAMGTSQSKFVRFSGVIETLQVVTAVRMLHHAFDLDVQLNGGRKIELSRKPETPPRVRLDLSPVFQYAVMTTEALASMKVEWVEGDRQWSQGLKIHFPRGPFRGNVAWEAHFFGRDRPLWVDGTPMWSSDAISYLVNQDELRKCNAAFGKVRMTVAARIETVAFKRTDKRANLLHQTSTGYPIELAFNRNEVSYRPATSDIIQIRAYDAQNRRLKMDTYAGSRNGNQMRYFWGIPVRVEMDVATRHLTHLMDFDLRQRPVNQPAYDAFKREVRHRHMVVKTLKEIDGARRQASYQYGEDLAGFYYMSGKGRVPAIDKEVALSDPKGQSRFGYHAQPYKGYYFTTVPKSKSHWERLDQTRKQKGRAYTYKGRRITALPARLMIHLAAFPEDNTRPSFLVHRGRVYFKHLNGRALTFIPENDPGSGWKEVQFIENGG